MRQFHPALVLLALAAAGARAAGPSEADYFSELPEVLTVTRLAQPLADTPGAVTIIDRETIRRSGARELVDLLRLAPGYLVGGWNGANPTAVYHAPIDEYGTRNLVLVDGRSVYSAFFLGDTHRGMMGVALEEIERIEILRGSNSAAYGANALFGVINIITRHAADTQGVALSFTSGEGGISDQYARAGWKSDNGSFRLGASRRSDSGYLQAHDDKKVSQFHFRSDLNLAPDQELMLSAGVSELAAGDGFPGLIGNGNPERTQVWRMLHLQGVWSRHLSTTEEIKLSASYDQEDAKDRFPFHFTAPTETVSVDFGGRGRRLNLEFQHQFSPRDDLRALWGVGYKYEDALSPPLYAVSKPVSLNEKRLFGNLEWRPHERWLINAGAFVTDHSRKGVAVMPRLMANFHVASDHTLRAGASRSARMPNIYELASDRFYQTVTRGLLRYDKSTGNVEPEVLHTEEIGYFGNFRQLRMTVDVRGYRETMRGAVDKKRYALPGYTVNDATRVNDYVNARDLIIRGYEVQVRFKPWQDAEVWLNHTDLRRFWSDNFTDHNPPQRFSTVALFQKLPGNLDLGVIHYNSTSMTWHNEARRLPAYRRTDIRLAYPFRIGATRLEAAVKVQAMDGNYVASHLDVNRPRMIQEHRAFGTLRIEF